MTIGDTGFTDGGIENPPFAIELGAAVAHQGGFAVTALETKAGVTQAVVTQVFQGALPPKRVELGPVHGDVQAPALAAAGGGLSLAVEDSDAGGSTLRLLRFDAQGVKWGPVLSTGRDASSAFGIAAAAGRAMVVWDDYEKSNARGVVRGVVFGIDGFGGGRDVLDLTGTAADAEDPQVLSRRGGYWLGYLAHGELRVKKQKAPSEPEDAGSFELLDAVPSWVEVVPLDPHGAPSAEPIRVSPPDQQVLGFQLLGGSSGDLSVVWRKERSTPGDLADEAQPGAFSLAQVLPDGTVRHVRLKLEELAVGLPSLFRAASSSDLWLSFVGASASLGLAKIGVGGQQPAAVFDTSKVDKGSAVLAYDGQRFLTARSRGRGVELTTVSCFESPLKKK